jgi:dihydrofolate reductase
MRLSLIVAMAQNRVIGLNGRLPWHLPAELKHFRAITMGHPIVMGRKTFDSIGRVLPGRRNIVITRNRDYEQEGIEIVYSLDEALDRCKGGSEVFVIGGAHVFEETVDRADRIYLTLVHVTVEGDTFFPKIDFNRWQEVERFSHPADAQNIYAYDFVVYDRK